MLLAKSLAKSPTMGASLFDSDAPTHEVEPGIDSTRRDVAHLVEHRTGTSPTQVRFPGATREFSPTVNFQCRLSYGVRKPPCAIARNYVCAHVKDPVFHVRVRWIMETLKHPACTLGWVARLCRSWLSRGRQPEFPLGDIPLGQYSCKKKKKKKSSHRM